jgi:hypothetical protein
MLKWVKDVTTDMARTGRPWETSTPIPCQLAG